jgi:hypothetical protein
MENTSLENWTKTMKRYVNKTSNHLFVDENNRMFKVIGFTHEGKDMYTSIRFNEKYFWMTIGEIEAKSPNSLFNLRTGFFPQWDKAKSIPNFKAARKLTKEIKELLENQYGKSDDIKGDVKKLIENENFLQKDLTSAA